MSARKAIVHLVPHTHWDREWYEPFQTFRMRLVALIDDILERMKTEPRLAFTLDGQLATVDDYLAIRPEAEAAIRSLVAGGRLAIGPWQVLMDEFLVSGETIVRNLEMGWRRARELGSVMEIGYLPDMFGHVAQMPQILRRAGIRHAVVWRGVPAAIDRHAFAWGSPDGSMVRAEYLVGGYGNAAYLFAVPERLTAKIEAYRAANRAAYGEHSVLAMYGTDHAVPMPGFVALVDGVNAGVGRTEVRIETLADYIAGFDAQALGGLPRWTGELRSSARANLLMGVTSARIDLKAACARAERLLERYAEALWALHAGAWPEALLRLAWSKIIESSAHDSICGCSVDEVADQVLVRLAEAEQIAQGVTDGAAAAVGRLVATGRTAILNPSPVDRADLVELDLAIPGDWPSVELELADGTRVPTQETGRDPALLFEREVLGRDLPDQIRHRLHGREIFQRQLNGYTIDRRASPLQLALELGREPEPAVLDVDGLLAEISTAAQADAAVPWRLTFRAQPRRTMVARVPVPPLGWTSLAARQAGAAGLMAGAVVPGAAAPVRTTERGLANGWLSVEVEPLGTLRLVGEGVDVHGAGRLVDGGDQGDTYNYAPPEEDRLVEVPESVQVRTIAAGPLVGELAIERRYAWPLGLADDGRRRGAATAPVLVTTRVELRAGESFARIRVEFGNPSSDHRLRFHVPLPEPADRSAAEGQFAVVERGLQAEGGHGEHPVPTFPARGWVDAGGVAMLLDHVTEYELVDDGRGARELALTLLRSTGLISRNVNPWREDPAGPEVAVPGAQLSGWRSSRFALYPHQGSWVEADVLGAAERYHHPFVTVAGHTAEAAAAEAYGLAIDGRGIVLSSLRRRGGWLELRLVAEHPEPTEAVLRGAFDAGRESDVFGRAGADLRLEAEGVLRLPFGPWEIRTVHLRPAVGASQPPTSRRRR